MYGIGRVGVDKVPVSDQLFLLAVFNCFRSYNINEENIRIEKDAEHKPGPGAK
jgi:hypothetical protein